MSLIAELKRRNVFRVGVAYAIVAWLLVEVASVVLPTFEAPDWVMKVVTFLVILGFPLALILAWAFELTPDGIKRETAADPGESVTHVTGRKLDFAIIGLLVIAVVFLVIDNYVMVAEPEQAEVVAEQVPGPESDSIPTVLPHDRPAIAVLPFNNLSPDAEHAFFADGLAEDLITRLSSWRAFPVIARNSSFQYRGGDVDLKRVSRELGVRYVVEGSVRRAGDRIRVNAQLIDAPTGEHVWAETYDRKVSDVFALQDEISAIIAASLVGDLTRAEGERARQRGTNNLEAWSLYQLGLQHFDQYTLTGFAEARAMFQRAAEVDPRFATAQGQLAVAGLSELMLGRSGPREEFVAGLMASARRAVNLDPRDPAAHLGLAGAYLAAGDIKNGLASSKKAVDLNPSMPMAWIWLGWAQLLAGDPEATITATERARKLNPQGAMVWIHDSFASAYWELGRYDEALEAAQRLVATQPTYLTGYAYIAMNAVALGRLEEARTAITEGRRVQPDLSLDLMQNYFGVSRPTIDARRNAALREAGLE